MKPASPKSVLRVVVVTANPRRSGTGAVQMSPVNGFANGFDGRGRSSEAARYRPMPLAPVARDAGREAWARAMARVFGSREVCAAAMGVTFQTACNWFDAFSTATGDKVMQFSRDYPEDYAAMLAEVSA